MITTKINRNDSKTAVCIFGAERWRAIERRVQEEVTKGNVVKGCVTVLAGIFCVQVVIQEGLK